MDKRQPGQPDNGAVELADVPVGQIQQNPFQPRKNFDQDELAALSASVKSHGILQPIVVRMVGEQFQLVAGERRLRAAQAAGMNTVPVRVVDFNDQEVLEAALAENIQRSDLNPIEKAHGFKDYLDRFGMNHEHLAQRLGLARSTITNLVNLLDLAPEVQEGLRVNQISEAHAKILKGIKSRERQVALFKQIVAQGLSVKALETMLREQKDSATATTPEKTEPRPTKRRAMSAAWKTNCGSAWPRRCEIRLRGKDKGQILINFESNDDFMRILEALRK